MLNARYLASISDDLVKHYAQLEQDIALEMARRIAEIQAIDDSVEYNLRLMDEVGTLRARILELVGKYNAEARPILEESFNGAMQKNEANDLKYFAAAKRELSDNQRQIIETSVKRFLNADTINKDFAKQQKIRESFDKTYNALQRMTLTIAESSQTAFISECNKAYMKVSTGMTSYSSAFKTAVKNLACEGVTAVQYTASGKARSFTIEAASRMNILTGINQTASEQTLTNAEELGVDLVEVSAHIGARDVDGRNPWSNHSAWQGKVYCLNGSRNYIDENGEEQFAPNFQETCGLGEVDGICGINCRHSYYPYFEGTPRNYSDGELDEMKDTSVFYDGHEMSQYEAEQKLRYIERNIRTAKREIDAINTIGGDSTHEREILQQWQAQARDFTEKTGISRDYIREYIGTRSTVQPKGIKSNAFKSMPLNKITNRQYG